MLETLVHQDTEWAEIPTLQYLVIDIPDEIELKTLNISDLPNGWRMREAATRALGDQWLREARLPLLQVPSVLVPETWNILINPQHTACQELKVDRTYHWPLDTRLTSHRP